MEVQNATSIVRGVGSDHGFLVSWSGLDRTLQVEHRYMPDASKVFPESEVICFLCVQCNEQ